MSLFVRKTVVFFILAIVFLFIIDHSASLMERSSASFKIGANVKYIVLGHSHPECAFNDSLLANFKNLSSSAEPYFYTYVKLQQLFKQNSNIETVFVEFTNNQITKDMDDWTWGDRYLTNRFDRYSSFISIPDEWVLIKNNFSGFRNAFVVSLKSKLIRLKSRDLNFTSNVGGYLYLQRDKTDSLVHVAPSNIVRGKQIDISETNLQYLKKVVTLCKNNNKRIFLIRSPLHERYEGYSFESTYKKILNERFSDVEYLDFSKFPLSNSEYGDLEHLNHKGARVFSGWLQYLLFKVNILDKKNKQKIIDRLMPHRDTR